ncbi:MAG: cytochrome c oxidase accessory protein FixG, partial [Sulfurimonas sp.]|uniref:cytochrome c oxidase accessory protein CcoG n=1 Tax=Sulfurimonas sp. TaxID=2022749 RepID=UPI0039E5C127
VTELYVMPFLLIILFVSVFTITAILGRFWCGWACPQTIFRVIYRDLIEGTLLDLRRMKNKQKEVDYSKTSNFLKTVVAIVLWSIISIIISSNFIWYFVPPEDFFVYIQEPMEHLFLISFVLSTALFLIYDMIFLKENFCTYVCPYSRTQNVLYDDDTKHVIYNTNRGGVIYENKAKSIFNVSEWSQNEECTTCEACVTVCPTHIDIRKGLQLECINCLECSDACATVMGKLDKESLISWGSSNTVIHQIKTSLFSPRNSVYFATILGSFILAAVFISEKEYLLVNVNKTTQLYRIDKNGLVNNGYVMAIHNTQDRAYTYDVKISGNENFEIKKFNPVTLDADKKAKKVLIIQSKENLNLSERKDTVLKLQLTIFAREDAKVKITRDVAFIYPRNELIK